MISTVDTTEIPRNSSPPESAISSVVA